MGLGDMIEEAGHEVVGAAWNMESALRLAPEADFVFMDAWLQDGLTGPETGRILAQDYGKAVYFATASEDQVVDAVGEDLGGALGLIRKPYGMAQISRALQEGEAWLAQDRRLTA
jgi:DNA-binding LytR/AlgR family response regulator